MQNTRNFIDFEEMDRNSSELFRSDAPSKFQEHKNSYSNNYSCSNNNFNNINKNSAGYLYETSNSKEDFVESIASGVSWSVNQLKMKKQYVLEKLGRTSRTKDSELEEQIQKVIENRTRYKEIHKTFAKLANSFQSIISTQRMLQIQFTEQGKITSGLQTQFSSLSNIYDCISRSAEKNLYVINSVVTALDTISNKTMKDTVLSYEYYEECRLQYDSLKNEMLGKAQSNTAKLEKKMKDMEEAREILMMKIRLLNDYVHKMMTKYLGILNEATLAFYSGNELALNNTIAKISKQ